MTNTLSDGGFWLPSEFLTDDDILMDKENFNKNGLLLNPAFGFNFRFPTEFPPDFGSFNSTPVINSPVESVVSSTETESDEDFLAALTRQLTRATLQETQKTTSRPQNIETWVLSGSPQSTLSGIGSWSSNGSPNGPSQVSSPPTTPLSPNDDAWSLINAAAGQVARLKITGGEGPPRSRGLLGAPRSHNPVYPSPPVKYPTTGFFTNQSLSHNLSQSHTPHFQVRQEQGLKQQVCSIWGGPAKEGFCCEQNQFQKQQMCQNRAVRGGGVGGCGDGGGGRPLGLPQSAWPPLQVQHQNQHYQNQQHSHGGSGMRAVFLGGGGSGGVKRECAGTGVFLPRRYGNPSDSRKKPAGCSTALLPARVVHALNKNLEDMASRSQQHQFLPRYNASLTSDYDGLMARRNALLAQQKRSLRSEGAINHEIRLPQEWTY
ncbi:uncharacterized protein LOC132312105 isoform X3 [Cornus florida]|uniref:uncharacterized protein LOC132312105 isoform X3 n=1 Tax=Cornus florida TaxID=4283 RepID=UPI0028A088C7|nr:uncharacterized protein LOC132312105 isoform X3 [Cornus florida]